MLDKDTEIGCFEILKNNFPDLNGQGLVMSINEFLTNDINLASYICKDITPKEAALHYIKENIPYIVLDETEGYKCVFIKGNFITAQYDVTNAKMIGYSERG